jgi:arabinogalactan oligomer / maltooligosaccharide transport system permease protein
MSTAAVPTRQPVRRRAGVIAWSLPTRAVSVFSGPAGTAIKIGFLGLVNALAVWAGTVLAGDGKWPAVAVLAAATVALDAIYLLPRGTLPLKFIVPGTVFLIAFHIVPVAYTVNVAFTNYSTGHILSKEEAIAGIERVSLGPAPNAREFVMAPARDADGDLVLILLDDASGKAFVGRSDRLEPLRRDEVKISQGFVVGAEGYKLLRGEQLVGLDEELAGFTVPTGGQRAIRPEGLETALELQPTLRYEPGRDAFVNVETGAVFRDNGRGSFASATGEELEPGWTTGVGFENFRRVFEDRLIRDPFVRVFFWTVTFAVLTVFLSFALGLFLAVTLNTKLRLQRVYRIALVFPYAIPSFLTILVWGGLLNDDFGVVNRILHLDVPWLFDAWWARVSLIIVSVWLTFPYFFLVSLGALQSIPGELVEAARVDGGGPWQVFRKITLPLLLIVVAPLLIASFAFNFNNFNNIFLLTGGGPPGEESVAGATDILITYTYKIAFESGKGQDYGLASAVSIFIFFIVGAISALAFWRSKSLENLA